MAALNDKQKQFLEQPFVGVVTTLREDGSPHSTVVWVDVDENGVSFNTVYGRTKPANLERDGRISLTVVDPADGYRWLSVDGAATLSVDGADDQIDRLAKKYLDADSYPFRKESEQRVTVRIAAARVDAYGLD